MPEPLTTSLLVELMPKLHAAFPRNLGKDNPTMMLDVYRNGLRGLSGEAVRYAVDAAIQSDSYFPKVARIRELGTQWQRHNLAPAWPVAETPWNQCAVCGAMAKSQTISRQRRDPAQLYAIVKNETAEPVWEDVESSGLYMLHDLRAHHVASFGEAPS